MSILYSQCWEDPATVLGGLNITGDDTVVSISSAGDNTFAIALKQPASIIAVDMNPEQLYLVELKMKAIEFLDYEEFISFVGVVQNGNRFQTYIRLRSYLSNDARQFWDTHTNFIENGIIHCGKLENYFRIFSQYILRMIHKKSTIHEFLSLKSLNEQKSYYQSKLNNIRWRWLFTLFFSRFIMSRIGRNKAFFNNVRSDNTASILFQRTEYGLTEISVSDNYFLQYIMTHTFNSPNHYHPYLLIDNFNKLKSCLDRIQLTCGTLDEVLSKLQARSISKFNLSDIFEYMDSEQIKTTLDHIVRVSTDKALISFWTLFNTITIPPSLKFIKPAIPDEQVLLTNGSKTFFYNNFCTWQVER
jgi:S-adenosylmethionine-diacylglycerol 3-amino-3-carboxypropyl transferase